MGFSPKDISLRRLTSQRVLAPHPDGPAALVSSMGAVQAQDYAMACWALGVRLPEASTTRVQEALDKGDIIRTHMLRPTWHFVAAKDASWMLTLTAPYIKATMRSRHRELELTPALINKSFAILERELTVSPTLSREDLVRRLQARRKEPLGPRASHILLLAELDQLICSGPALGKKNSYSLFSARIPNAEQRSREESLALLSKKYFSSHGPATLDDFTWWSGLPVREARNALALAGGKLRSEKLGAATYWFADDAANTPTGPSLFLLPAFDEFIISYRDRTPSLAQVHKVSTISSNGIFRPVVVFNGQVIGIWKKTLVRKKPVVETSIFPKVKVPQTAAFQKRLREASQRVVDFYSTVA